MRFIFNEKETHPDRKNKKRVQRWTPNKDSTFFGLAKKRVELAIRRELIEATEAVERKPVVMPPLRAKFNPKELNEFIKSINPEAYEFEEVVKFACDYLARYFKLVVGRDLKVIEYEYEVFDEGYIIVQHLERSEAGAKARLCKNLIGGKNIFVMTLPQSTRFLRGPASMKQATRLPQRGE